MTFSVAITTYNRPTNLANLVKQIRACTLLPDQILVVDSSDQLNDAMFQDKAITYIQSSHKNQPYQRYLAYLACKTEVIIFLDDDLEIIDFTVFKVMLERLGMPEIRGISVGFQHHNAISSLMESKVDGKSLFFKIINFISGVPVLRPGRIYMAGLSGPRPLKESTVDYFNGAVMGFFQRDLSHLYNPILFSLFEKKIGMGEDKIISMTLGLTSSLWFVPHHFFLHPPVTSNYFDDVRLFQRKIMYSRLFLSLQYGRSKNYHPILIYIHYYYFASWRLLIASIQALIKPGKQRAAILKGIFQGVLLTFTLPFDEHKITPQIDWDCDAEQDTTKSN